MAKCPCCGAEVEVGVKFCCECGAKIPQSKECPQCHAQLPLAVKFCGECGYGFLTGGHSKAAVIGDKNVIAGDLHVDQSSTVSNNTTNNVVNNTSNSTSNVTTTHNYINQDETKHLVKCVVCERQIVITEARTCKECHQPVCAEHYDAPTGLCVTCSSKKTSEAEAAYRKELETILEDGIVDRDEFDQLEVLRKQLGLSFDRAVELQKIMKAEMAAKKTAVKGEVPLMMVERAQCDRAKDLLFDRGKGQEAVKLLESIYRQHPFNEEVLATYLAALFTYDEDRAKSIVSSLPVDIVRAYLVLFDIELKHGDLAAAEVKLAAAEALWPQNMLLKCRRAELMYATAVQLDNRTYLAEAMDLLTSLDKPADKLEASWQFYVQCLISQALGDEIPALTPAYCQEKGYYYALVTGQITGIAVINENDLCARCLRNRDFGAGVIPSVTKAEFKVLDCAAKRGEPRAALIVGDCYFDVDGNGVVMNNPEEAFCWYKRSAEGGLADAQFMVGACYENGMGCVADSKQALVWYKKAAEQGVSDAAERVAELSGAGEKHKYKLVISPKVVKVGIQCFESQDEFEESNLSDYRGTDNLDCEFVAECPLLDGAHLCVTDEDEDVVFEADLDVNNDESGIGHDLDDPHGNWPFFDASTFNDVGMAIVLVVKETYRQNLVSEFVATGVFDPGKFRILYREFTQAEDPFKVIWDLSYDEESLKQEFEGDDDPIEQTSWAVTAEGIEECDVWNDAEEESDDSEHEYRLEIETRVLAFGRQKFENRDELDASDWADYDDPEKLEDCDVSALLNGAELKVYDEKSNCIFSQVFDPSKPGEVEFVDDGDLFPDKPVFEDEEVYLYVCKEYKKNRVSKLVTTGEFEAAKLSIKYRSIEGHDGCTNSVILDLKYDGNRLDRDFVGNEKANNKWSWLELSDEYDRNFSIWDPQEGIAREDAEEIVEEGDEVGVDLEKIREAIRAFKNKYDCEDVILPESVKFHKKWSNFAKAALDSMQFFSEDKAIALLDGTVFGSCKVGALFDESGICCMNDWTSRELDGFMSWHDFAEKGNIAKEGSFDVRICSDPKIGVNVSGCSVLNVEKAKAFFTAVLNATK